jgi:hypothetical protein
MIDKIWGSAEVDESTLHSFGGHSQKRTANSANSANSAGEELACGSLPTAVGMIVSDSVSLP